MVLVVTTTIKEKFLVLYEVCGFKGHTMDTYYRVVGYLADCKGKKKGCAHITSPTQLLASTSVLNTGT